MNLVITTNGPGEVSTWVRPVIKAFKLLDPGLRVWIFITPCMFASGNESRILRGFEGIESVFSVSELYSFILFGKKPESFEYSDNGAVLCLGGDTAFAIALAKRLKYRGYAYCERAAGITYRTFDYFVPSEEVLHKLTGKGAAADSINVIGRLEADTPMEKGNRETIRECIGAGREKILVNVFPGSRYSMIELSIPFFFQVVEGLPDDIAVMFTIAPYISMSQVEQVLDRNFAGVWNYISRDVYMSCVKIRDKSVFLYHGSQYDAMAASDMAVALPGSNNKELALMHVPVLVVLPLNYPDRIPLPGVAGCLGRMPVIGKKLKAKVLFPSILKRLVYISPFNREMGCGILPEMAGILQPEDIKMRIIEICSSDLARIRECLYKANNPAGASGMMAMKILADLKGGL